MPSLTACQVRAARAMLRWSIGQLSSESGVSERTITRIEAGWGRPRNTTTETLYRLIECFERQGIVFIGDDGSNDGPGVRLSRYPGRSGGSIPEPPQRP